MTCNHTRSESKPYCVACDPVHEWLHIHDRIVKYRERNRIIELLEDECECHPDKPLCWAAKAIDLIRGSE